MITESDQMRSGDTCIEVDFLRGKSGLRVRVKATPEVEEFIKTLGQGEEVAVGNYGRYWTPLPSQEGLYAYDMSSKLQRSAVPFTLEALGSQIDLSYDSPNLVNTSFLRLVGISKGDGVTFILRGVYSHDAIMRMRDLVGAANRQFYIDYLRPMHVTVATVTREA